MDAMDASAVGCRLGRGTEGEAVAAGGEGGTRSLHCNVTSFDYSDKNSTTSGLVPQGTQKFAFLVLQHVQHFPPFPSLVSP